MVEEDGFTGDQTLSWQDLPVLREEFRRVVVDLAAAQQLRATIIAPDDVWNPVIGDEPTGPIQIELHHVSDGVVASPAEVTEFFELLEYHTHKKGVPQIKLDFSYVVEFRVKRL